CLRLGPFAPRAVLLHRYIREDRAYCRSTRPGCECQPAAAELPITPFAPGAVLLHRYISENRGCCRSTRPGCECQPAVAELPITPFAPRAVLLHRHIRQDRTRCRSTRTVGVAPAQVDTRKPRLLYDHPPRVRRSAGGGGAADNPVRTEGGAPTQTYQRRPDPL